MHRVMYISYSEQCVYKVALYINWCDFPNINFIWCILCVRVYMNAEAKAFWKSGDFKTKHIFSRLNFCSGINLITDILCFWILLLKTNCCWLFLTSLWTTGCDSRTANGGDKSNHSVYIPWIQHWRIRCPFSVGTNDSKYKWVCKEMLVCKFLFYLILFYFCDSVFLLS